MKTLQSLVLSFDRAALFLSCFYLIEDYYIGNDRYMIFDIFRTNNFWLKSHPLMGKKTEIPITVKMLDDF